MHVLHRVLLRRADGTDKIKRNFVHRKTQYQTTLSPEVWNMTWEKVTKQTARNKGVKEMKRSIAILLCVVMVLGCLALSACGKKEEAKESAEPTATAGQATATVSPSASASESQTPAPTATATQAPASSAEINNYGYAGQDAKEAEIYRYLATDLAKKNFETGEGIYSVPVVSIIDTADAQNGGTDVWGYYEVYNYKIDGETLSCVSGGSFPGKMNLTKNGDSYTVSDFTIVADGADNESSAREIFGDKYEKYAALNSNPEARASTRTQTLANYVKANGLKVTQYQDYGWDPVKLF